MVANLLLSKFRTRFPSLDIHIITKPHLEIVIPAAHPDVGSCKIYDDGDEIVLDVGNFTHTHFSNYDKTLSEDQAAEKISEDVIKFFIDLFADQIVLWGSHQGIGGFYRRGWEPNTPFSENQWKEYVWSGPLLKNDQ